MQSFSIPHVVFYQAINIGILSAILWFFLKNKFRFFLKNRKESYEQAILKVEKAKLEMEQKNKEIIEKSKKLEFTSSSSLKQAEVEAIEYKKNLLKEAEEMAERIRMEAKKSVDAELRRNIKELKEKIATQAINSSRLAMKQQIEDSDQRRLKEEFENHIQSVI